MPCPPMSVEPHAPSCSAGPQRSGGHVQACPDGHVSRVWYNACRHRSCPHCAALQTERWLALQRARLLACDHSHVIYTLPHDLDPLWLANGPR